MLKTNHSSATDRREELPSFILLVTVTPQQCGVCLDTACLWGELISPCYYFNIQQGTTRKFLCSFVEGEVREKPGSFQHLRNTHMPVDTCLNYPQGHLHYSPESLWCCSDMLNMQNLLLFALLFLKWETWVSKPSQYRFRGYIRFQLLWASRQMFDFPLPFHHLIWLLLYLSKL